MPQGLPDSIRLTQYSHGAGCGCKIAPATLDKIVKSSSPLPGFANLVVGNESKDDAAVVDLGDGTGVISTTDFFMPIVDDPFDFGRIAATNAISDVYAMGGTPLMAIAILGWPLDKLSPEVANQVVEGGRQVCAEAGIALAGGHSIDAPEPIFGLAVTGRVCLSQLKRNDQAQTGDVLFLTKPLGIGILSTAQKQGLLKSEHQHIARDWMCQLNVLGQELARIDGVNALTDVTGFGLLGHLLELCQGSMVKVQLDMSAVPVIPEAREYAQLGTIPGGTRRNYDSYGQHASALTPEQRDILCDPQTSGGLLISVNTDACQQVQALLERHGLPAQIIGEAVAKDALSDWVSVK